MNSFSTERVGKSPESEFRKRWHASSAPVDAWVALLTRHSAGKKNACDCLEDAFSPPCLLSQLMLQSMGMGSSCQL